MGTDKHIYDNTPVATLDGLSSALASVQYVKSKMSASSSLPMKVRMTTPAINLAPGSSGSGTYPTSNVVLTNNDPSVSLFEFRFYIGADEGVTPYKMSGGLSQATGYESTYAFIFNDPNALLIPTNKTWVCSLRTSTLATWTNASDWSINPANNNISYALQV